MRATLTSVLAPKYTSIFLGFCAVACGSAGAAVPPVTPAAAGVVSSSSESSTSHLAPVELAPEKGDAQPVPEAFDLRDFRPLLSRENLRAVRLAIDEQRHEDAADRIQQWMKQESPEGIDRARFSYLLGSQHKLAGDLDAAVEALSGATETPWVLRDDARLLLAEVQLQRDNPQAALKAVRDVSSEVDMPRLLLVRASAHQAADHLHRALADWKRLVESRPSPRARLALAECLIALAEGEDRHETEARALAEKALRHAWRATVGFSESSAEAVQARQVEKAARRLGAQNLEEDSDVALLHMEQLVDARLYDEAEKVASEVQLADRHTFSEDRCKLDYLKAKVLAGQREWGAGADKLAAATRHCADNPELHAKILFNAGKFSAADGRHTAAVEYYRKIEELYPNSSLADDSRLRAARSYLDVGVVARFTELLLALPEDYPDGDMTMEGVLELALYRMERKDWAGAAVILERGARVARKNDSARGHEKSGRERYFWARSLAELGEEERALDEYELIVEELPLSYYMLHAYSRLKEEDPERAHRALQHGLQIAKKEPFSFPYRPEYDTPRFRRGMELLRVGELSRGRSVLGKVNLAPGTDESLLWGLALLYDRAGDAHVSHRIARGKLTDWFAHYPEGDWLRPWKIGFPRPYQSIVTRESQKTGVPEWFIYGVMREESTFDARVVSHADAYGLMQLIIPTARAFARKAGLPATPAALKRPSVNIALGTRVLESLSRRFDDNPWLAIPGYNAGPGRPLRWMRERPDVDFDVWVELIPFRETRRYTKRVLASRAAYAFVYYRDQAEQALLLPKRLERQ